MNKLVFASTISEIKQSDIFMTVKARICEAPAANLNGARVTEAFISEIVKNKDRYIGLPLYADVRSLTKGDYRRLGHLYDSKTGEFHSTQIGSFYQFEKEEFEGGCYLVGYARIAKRNKKLSKAISELFADNALKFSFEVAVGEYEELDDNTILIDASDSNYLEGTAIVTFPACEDAVALELVAQQKADDTEGGETEMAEKEKVTPEKVETAASAAEPAEAAAETTEQPVVAEQSKVAESPVVAESPETAKVAAETTEETPAGTPEIADCKKKKEEAEDKDPDDPEEDDKDNETAAVVVRETTEQSHVTYAYDTENGMEVMQHVNVETSVSHVEPEAQIVETDQGVQIAEGEEVPGVVEDEAPDNAAEEDVPAVEEPKKKTAEEMIAELAETIKDLTEEVKSLRTAAAEKLTVAAEAINPFVDSMTTHGSYYDLLQPAEKKNGYDLLSK